MDTHQKKKIEQTKGSKRTYSKPEILTYTEEEILRDTHLALSSYNSANITIAGSITTQ